jgi:hypothetical protein
VLEHLFVPAQAGCHPPVGPRPVSQCFDCAVLYCLLDLCFVPAELVVWYVFLFAFVLRHITVNGHAFKFNICTRITEHALRTACLTHVELQRGQSCPRILTDFRTGQTEPCSAQSFLRIALVFSVCAFGGLQVTGICCCPSPRPCPTCQTD